MHIPLHASKYVTKYQVYWEQLHAWFQHCIYRIFNHIVLMLKPSNILGFDFRDLSLEVDTAIHNPGFRTEFLKNSSFQYYSDLKNSFKM